VDHHLTKMKKKRKDLINYKKIMRIKKLNHKDMEIIMLKLLLKIMILSRKMKDE
jgi:hypothetical protein